MVEFIQESSAFASAPLSNACTNMEVSNPPTEASESSTPSLGSEDDASNLTDTDEGRYPQLMWAQTENLEVLYETFSLIVIDEIWLDSEHVNEDATSTSGGDCAIWYWYLMESHYSMPAIHQSWIMLFMCRTCCRVGKDSANIKIGTVGYLHRSWLMVSERPWWANMIPKASIPEACARYRTIPKKGSKGSNNQCFCRDQDVFVWKWNAGFH